MKRLHALLLLLMLSTQPFTAMADGSGASEKPDHIALSWTKDPATTMTVTWRTSNSVTSGIVQYTTAGAKAGQAKAAFSDLSTDSGTIRIFSTTLTGLRTNSNYSYRVGDGKHWSGTYTFKTADPSAASVKFLVFGDSQSVASGAHPYGIWRKTIQNAFKANPDARFFINVGDLSDSGAVYAHWNGWFSAAEGVIDSIPAMPVCGNHETYGSSSRRPTLLTRQFALPENGPAGLKEQAYSYNYGPVHMVALDSQQDEERVRGMLKQESVWLDKDLKSSQAVWKIAYFHKGPYGVSDRRNDGVKAALCPVMEKDRVDVVFNGHDHGIGRTYPIKGGVRMQKPSQGTVYYVVGRSGSKTYKDLGKKPWDAFFYNPLDQPNYLVVEASRTGLTIKTFKQDGTLIDTYSIDR